jgi:hypothetical protein
MFSCCRRLSRHRLFPRLFLGLLLVIMIPAKLRINKGDGNQKLLLCITLLRFGSDSKRVASAHEQGLLEVVLTLSLLKRFARCRDLN